MAAGFGRKSKGAKKSTGGKTRGGRHDPIRGFGGEQSLLGQMKRKKRRGRKQIPDEDKVRNVGHLHIVYLIGVGSGKSRTRHRRGTRM